MNNLQIPELVLAKNTYTGKHINLKPLFHVAFELTDKGEANLKSIKQKIDDAIRLLSTNRFEERDVDDYAKELVFNLYQISDAFEEMENF